MAEGGPSLFPSLNSLSEGPKDLRSKKSRQDRKRGGNKRSSLVNSNLNFSGVPLGEAPASGLGSFWGFLSKAGSPSGDDR